MKKSNIFICLLLIITLLPFNVNATTLKEYENKVAKYQSELTAAKKAIKQTESEIAYSKQQVKNAQKEVQDLEEEISEKNQEIQDGNEEIKKKGLETKQFFEYFQIADGENKYLEYAFGADNVTDFIYRMSIVEQMAQYNDEVIKDLEKMIERNEKRKVEIKEKEKQLEQKEKNLETQITKLGEKKSSLETGGADSATQLKIWQDIVASYKKKGCKSNDVIGVDCAVDGPAGKFRRPTKVGLISSEFGWRSGKLHRAVDVTSPNKKNEKIYPVANGTIIAKYNDTNGALVLMIEHYDSESKKWYTSDYCHMSKYASGLYVGKYVTSEDYIGYMGNTGYVIPKPTKSNPDAGTHLHMEIAPCRIYKDSKCSTWSKYVSFMTTQANNGFKGPRALINFPKTGVKWTTR